MKQPLPESYLDLLAGAETLAAWQPSDNVLADVSNWNRRSDNSETACQLKDLVHAPGASVAGVRILPETPNAILHNSGWTQSCKSEQLAAPNGPNQQPACPQLQQQQEVEKHQERHLSHITSRQREGQLAAMQQPLLPSPPHQQQQLQQSADLMQLPKRSREQSPAALDDSDWRSAKRRSITPVNNQPTRQLQLEQQPTALVISSRVQEANQGLASTGVTDSGSSAGRSAAVANPALTTDTAANGFANDVELCLPDSQPEAEHHAAMHHAAAQARFAPAAIGSHTNCAAGLIPFVDYIPATEMDVAPAAAAAAAGPVLFRDFVPATELNTTDGVYTPRPTCEPDGPRFIMSTARLASVAPAATALSPDIAPLPAMNTSVTVAAADDASVTTATTKPCTALRKALVTAAVPQQQASCGLVLFESFVPATELSDRQPEQLATADAPGPGHMHLMQQLSAAMTAVGTHQAAGQAPPAVAAGNTGDGSGGDGDRSQDQSCSGCCGCMCSCRSPTGSRSSNETSSSLISSDDEDCNLQQQQQQGGVAQQHAIYDAACWQDIGETQPQPQAITRIHLPLGTSRQQQQLLPQYGSAANLAVLDAGETQPQPSVVAQQRQQQQQLVEGTHLPDHLQQSADLDLKEFRPLPAADLQQQQAGYLLPSGIPQRQNQQQQQKQKQQLWDSRQPAAKLEGCLQIGQIPPVPSILQQQLKRKRLQNRQEQQQQLDARQLAAKQQLQGHLDAAETEPQTGAMTQRQLPIHHVEDLQQQQEHHPQSQHNMLQQQQASSGLQTLEQQHRNFEQGILADQQQQQQQQSRQLRAAEAGAADACLITAQGPSNIVTQRPAAMAAPGHATVTWVPDVATCCHTSTTAAACSSGSTGLHTGLAPQVVAATPSERWMIPSAATDCGTDRSPDHRPSLPGTHSREAAAADAPAAATSGRASKQSTPVSHGRLGVDRTGGSRAPAGGWHVPTRHRRWNTAPKPGSIMSFWNKAGVLDIK